MKSTVFFTILFFSLTSFAKISFNHSPSTEWETLVRDITQKIHNLLPEDWPEIGHCQIYFIENGNPSYKPVFRYQNQDMDILFAQKVLVLNSSDPEVIAHEYSHFLLDDYMRKMSPAWKHFFIWVKYQNDIHETILITKKSLSSLQNTLLEFENDPTNTLNLDRLRNSIKKYKANLIELNEALEIERKYDFSLYALSSFKAMAPYYELHADSLAAIALENWQAMKNITIKNINDPELSKQLVLPKIEPKESAIKAFIEARNFLDNLDPNTYSYQPWEATGNYSQFAPFRSYLKRSIENDYSTNKQEFIKKFTESIVTIYEKTLLPYPENVNRTLKEKNLELIELMNQ